MSYYNQNCTSYSVGEFLVVCRLNMVNLHIHEGSVCSTMVRCLGSLAYLVASMPETLHVVVRSLKVVTLLAYLSIPRPTLNAALGIMYLLVLDLQQTEAGSQVSRPDSWSSSLVFLSLLPSHYPSYLWTTEDIAVQPGLLPSSRRVLLLRS